MNGEIQVESEYGKGSVFTFTMQLKLQDQGCFEDDHLRDLPVLVVDDDIVCCENACMRINEIGMKGEYAISGEEAIGKVERAHHLNDDYFAVILDLKMPRPLPVSEKSLAGIFRSLFFPLMIVRILRK